MHQKVLVSLPLQVHIPCKDFYRRADIGIIQIHIQNENDIIDVYTPISWMVERLLENSFMRIKMYRPTSENQSRTAARITRLNTSVLLLMD